MAKLHRRTVLRVGGLGGALAGAGMPSAAWAAGQSAAARDTADTLSADNVVRLTGDGLGLTAPQYARVLAGLAERGIAEDDYILGGVVAELEGRMAKLLGKERAVFMPTGTLANNLAIRTLAGNSRKAVVQADSHIYLDSGDCVQTLSQVTLMPLGEGRATFTADELTRLIARNNSGRVSTPIGVVSIESPVRRMRGQIFDPAELAKIVAVARSAGIALHLDGARLFLEAAYARRDVAEYCKPFDTVYVSLYKYFNASFGAILAGPRRLLDEIYHVRRMFGGGLSHAWTSAAVALHYLDGFDERYRRAVGVSEDLARRLGADTRFTVTRESNGTNLMRVAVRTSDPQTYRQRLASRGIQLGAPGANGVFLVATNETINRKGADELVDSFIGAL
jgi:threonine aldolase